jgi:hypothetical protein
MSIRVPSSGRLQTSLHVDIFGIVRHYHAIIIIIVLELIHNKMFDIMKLNIDLEIVFVLFPAVYAKLLLKNLVRLFTTGVIVRKYYSSDSSTPCPILILEMINVSSLFFSYKHVQRIERASYVVDNNKEPTAICTLSKQRQIQPEAGLIPLTNFHLSGV